ncbi:Uncharacterized protein DBV15_07146 [Temnothorax longispinosus]|uniref:Uncharacterized protein n=1 Tax=Temnothorax longispinosus TaxID=300112 RepID=A0A4S2L1V4_9HYME|nr:Uncharacterized protein DBV15_07146 [Temnothorax longispinosus]
MRSGEAAWSSVVQWLTLKVTHSQKAWVYECGRNSTAYIAIGFRCTASTESQASQNSKEIPFFEISRVFDIFVIHSSPDPVSIFSFRSSGIATFDRATKHETPILSTL